MNRLAPSITAKRYLAFWVSWNESHLHATVVLHPRVTQMSTDTCKSNALPIWKSCRDEQIFPPILTACIPLQATFWWLSGINNLIITGAANSPASESINSWQCMPAWLAQVCYCTNPFLLYRCLPFLTILVDWQSFLALYFLPTDSYPPARPCPPLLFKKLVNRQQCLHIISPALTGHRQTSPSKLSVTQHREFCMVCDFTIHFIELSAIRRP